MGGGWWERGLVGDGEGGGWRVGGMVRDGVGGVGLVGGFGWWVGVGGWVWGVGKERRGEEVGVEMVGL